MPTKARSVRSPGDGVMGYYEPFYVGLGTEHGVSERAVCCLH